MGDCDCKEWTMNRANVFPQFPSNMSPMVARSQVSVGGTARDLSRPVFSPGQNRSVAEFVRAVPKVKGSPVRTESVGSNTTLSVQVYHAASALNEVPEYTDSSPPAAGVTALSTPTTFELTRLGVAVSALKIDSSATAKNSAGNPTDVRLGMAAADVARSIDFLLGGNDGVGVTVTTGLRQLIDVYPARATDALLSPVAAALRCLASVCPNGHGAGEGPHCLIGNTDVLHALMASSVSIPECGWREDSRIGGLVYHFMGIPFYRVAATTDGTEDPRSVIAAANFGTTGLALVHAYGSADSLGIQIDEEPVHASTASASFLVHGAFALMCWEPEAFYACTNVGVAKM